MQPVAAVAVVLVHAAVLVLPLLNSAKNKALMQSLAGCINAAQKEISYE
ncbi:hypothetical protein [Listeria valentina]|nr:hypothetical protein [Listeria valentina]